MQPAGQSALTPSHTEGAQDGEPALPRGWMVHVPTLPIRSQASQAPAHAALQQTPSTQKPLPHWLARVQQAPFGWGATQRPAQLHTLPAAQSPSTRQAPGQLPRWPSQR